MKHTAGLCFFGAVLVTAFDGGNKPDLPVNGAAKVDVQPATYSEYDKNNEARCDGSATNTLECWTDPSGAVFRYGCVAGDDKVWTDTCTSCGQCDGNWKWGGEAVNTCYYDGNNLYEYHCGDGEHGHTDVDMTENGDGVYTNGGSSSSCAALGWPLTPGSLEVCGASKIDGGCSGPVDYATAEAICADAGARLCTADELANDETKGTGCKGDCAAVWTSDECDAGHTTAAGSAKCNSKVPAECTSDDVADLAIARCCADANGSGADMSYPEGYHPAVSSDYSMANGACGLAKATKKYSCWTNPKTGQSQRFACKPGDQAVYTQSCGTDSDCASASCDGEWKKVGEFLNKCYSSARVLYQYSCPAHGG